MLDSMSFKKANKDFRLNWKFFFLMSYNFTFTKKRREFVSPFLLIRSQLCDCLPNTLSIEKAASCWNVLCFVNDTFTIESAITLILCALKSIYYFFLLLSCWYLTFFFFIVAITKRWELVAWIRRWMQQHGPLIAVWALSFATEHKIKRLKQLLLDVKLVPFSLKLRALVQHQLIC